MKVVIIERDYGRENSLLEPEESVSMLPIANKPFIQYQLEWCVQQGIQDVTVCLSRSARNLEEFCHQGERWGLKISYENFKSTTAPYQMINYLQSLKEGNYCIVPNDTFCFFSLADLIQIHKSREAMVTVGLTSSNYPSGHGFVRIADKNNRILSFIEEKKYVSEQQYYTNTGIYFLNTKLFRGKK